MRKGDIAYKSIALVQMILLGAIEYVGYLLSKACCGGCPSAEANWLTLTLLTTLAASHLRSGGSVRKLDHWGKTEQEEDGSGKVKRKHM